jgi:putative transposase
MSDKYKGIYRGQTFRLQHWDYGSEGLYFITICTQNREHFFGEINDGNMILSEIGDMAHKNWIEITNQYSFIKLGNFVIMPNHVHGILEIDKSVDNIGTVDNCRDAINRVPTIINPNDSPNSNEINGGFAGIKNPMFHENISRVIRWYKGRCSFEMRKINPNFKWQSLFHDHVIRNQQAFKKIQQYIIDNPKNWKDDRFHE